MNCIIRNNINDLHKQIEAEANVSTPVVAAMQLAASVPAGTPTHERGEIRKCYQFESMAVRLVTWSWS